MSPMRPRTRSAGRPSEWHRYGRMPLAAARRLLVDQEQGGDGQSLVALVRLDRWLARGNAL